MNVTQIAPETLIVTRDGHLDDDYYEMVYEQKRREALHAVGHELVNHVLNTPKLVGHGVLSIITILAEQAN